MTCRSATRTSSNPPMARSSPTRRSALPARRAARRPPARGGWCRRRRSRSTAAARRVAPSPHASRGPSATSERGMTQSEAEGLSELIQARVRDIPDFPKPGVTFKDITPILDDHVAFTLVVDALARAGRDAEGDVVVDKVVGMEARGFILAAPVALSLGVGFVPV